MIALLGSLFSKVPLRAWLLGLGALAIVTVLGLGFRHYSGVLSENVTLRQNEAVLKTALDAQRQATASAVKTVDEWRAAAEHNGQVLQDLAAAQVVGAAELRRLNDVFSQHDLGKLAAARPARVAPLVNRGSDRARRLLECATGAAGADCPARSAPPQGPRPPAP